MKRREITHEFVGFIPEEMEDGIVYVTIEYATAVHRCCCGCGSEVVTNFSPTDWRLIFDGETISLDPSVGNWSFPCRSHYWIRRNKVVWAGRWSPEQVAAGRERDRADKAVYFGEDPSEAAIAPPAEPHDGAWRRTRRRVTRRYRRRP